LSLRAFERRNGVTVPEGSERCGSGGAHGDVRVRQRVLQQRTHGWIVTATERERRRHAEPEVGRGPYVTFYNGQILGRRPARREDYERREDRDEHCPRD
jgi:hypothetical protein